MKDAAGLVDAGLKMRMAALGVRRALAGPLAVKADAFGVDLRSEAVPAMDAAGVAPRRLRLAPELARRWLAGGSVVRARVDMGVRVDAGAGDSGAGAEAGGEFGFAHAGSGLVVEARGRALLMHQSKGFREWGAGFAVRLRPGRGRPGDGEAPEGLSLSFAPTWGRAAGGAQTLWAAEGGLGGLGGFGAGAPGQADAPGWAPDRVGLELGWGVPLPGGGVVAPFGGWSREGGGGSRMNAGARWAAADLPAAGRARVGRLTLPRGLRLMVDFFAEQLAGPLGPPERRFALVGRVSF